MSAGSVYDAYRQWAGTPLTEPPRISVVVPAYNEEWRILPTIAAVAGHMSARGEPWELIVCDDGSTDATVAQVRGLGFANLTLLRSEQNRGKGDAVRRGMRAARGELVLFTDADLSTPIEQFDALAAPLRDGADVAIASRTAAGALVQHRHLYRRIRSATLRGLVSLVFGVRASDTQCGFKLFTRQAAHDLFARQTMEGFSFDLEILYLAGRSGYRVVEVPVEWIEAPGSRVKPVGASLTFLHDLSTIRWRHRPTRSARPRSIRPDPAVRADALEE